MVLDFFIFNRHQQLQRITVEEICSRLVIKMSVRLNDKNTKKRFQAFSLSGSSNRDFGWHIPIHINT